MEDNPKNIRDNPNTICTEIDTLVKKKKIKKKKNQAGHARLVKASIEKRHGKKEEAKHPDLLLSAQREGEKKKNKTTRHEDLN
jgi:hypothetical protein